MEYLTVLPDYVKIDSFIFDKGLCTFNSPYESDLIFVYPEYFRYNRRVNTIAKVSIPENADIIRYPDGKCKSDKFYIVYFMPIESWIKDDSIDKDIKKRCRCPIVRLSLLSGKSDIPYSLQLEAVSVFGSAVKHIPDPSEEIQRLAVENDVSSIEYIENPSEWVQMYVVSKDICNIYYIKSPIEKVQLYAIEKCRYILYLIRNPTDKAVLAATRNSPDFINYFMNPNRGHTT